MTQKIKHIPIKDLVLWTENPRDPIGNAPGMTDQEMADYATREDRRSRWDLDKLINKMGEHYDLSELPTVVYENGKHIVYDGNRRMLIGKIVHGLVEVKDIGADFSKLDFPKSVPCNVCDKKTALKNTYRKHTGTGSWGMIEREIFKYRYMGEETKSTILIFEDATGYISKSEKMNQGFVKREVLTLKNLEKLGFPIIEGELQSQYKRKEDAMAVLDAVAGHIEREEITTRTSRGDIIRLLDEALLSRKAEGEPKPFSVSKRERAARPKPKPKPTPHSKVKRYQLFGDENLVLELGMVNNLYRDLRKLYEIRGQKRWSECYPAIVCFGLRFTAEQAAMADDEFKNIKSTDKLEKYIQKHYEKARKALSKEERKELNDQQVTDNRGTQDEDRGKVMVTLLNSAAHAYSCPHNDRQAVAISLILGKMLEISHGKKQK